MQNRSLRVVLVAINAQYIHTGLGARSLAAYLRQETTLDIILQEYTINQREADILQALVETEGDVYLFSCYLWNIQMALNLAQDIRQLCPAVHIGLGGPQAGYQPPAFLLDHQAVDWLLQGEGEDALCQLLQALATCRPVTQCPGLVCRHEGKLIQNPPPPPLSMDRLAFAYPDIASLSHRIIYYESMRGCPFSCSYCTSSLERGVRKRSLSLVFADLSIFIENKVPQVKFVDRTFNCDKKRALALWKWLVAQDKGYTNFHFELAGHLLDDEMLHFLSTVRPGLFQFEIGVQSTSTATLEAVDRKGDVAQVLAQARKLLAPGNIHLHLDLIAGLPREDFKGFQASFNRVYGCRPHQLQLGFLKVLPGSAMESRAKEYGLVYRKTAPHQILQNQWLSYQQLCLLEGVAHMVDTYYNSGRFAHGLQVLEPLFADGFSLYQALWFFYHHKTEGRPVSHMDTFNILFAFGQAQGFPSLDALQWALRYDLLLHQKPRKLPAFLTLDGQKAYRQQIQAFYKNRENIIAYLPEYVEESSLRIERITHLEVFPSHPDTGAREPTPMLFSYHKRDLLGRARVQALPPAIFFA